MTIGLVPGLIDEILEQGTVVAIKQAAAASFRLIEDVLRHRVGGRAVQALIEHLRCKGNLAEGPDPDTGAAGLAA